MSTTSTYVIFEPDQVLTNDHLNELFDYLDYQERLTRNKLLGIGIACGLQISHTSKGIHLSEGCGVTSKGYLIVQEDADYNQYTPYTLPSNPVYKPFFDSQNNQYKMWRLLTDEEAKTVDSVKKDLTPGFETDMILVLFLEANEIDLKNCTTQDCNDKGKEMDLTVRPLLISSKDMDSIIVTLNKASGESIPYETEKEWMGLPDVPLKRWNVKATTITSFADIYNSYLNCLNDDLFTSLKNAYSTSYSIFSPLLKKYPTNPFENLQSDISKKFDFVKKSMPIFIQYFYDWIDDLIKAYEEFRKCSRLIWTECYPSEELFPMHLMIGEADKDSSDLVLSHYRNYFIYSPLFKGQEELREKLVYYMDRMVKLTKGFINSDFPIKPFIKITPSNWSLSLLSKRAIPYYYTINIVAPSWNYEKSKKNQSYYNLSYNSDKYPKTPQTGTSPATPPDNILNPLLYNLESYDFYRVEGHIGMPYATALSDILSQRNTYRLPFDVIALKAGVNGTSTSISFNCHFEDLEAEFAILKSELACKIHEPVCFAGQIKGALITPPSTGGNIKIIDILNNHYETILGDTITMKRKMVMTDFVAKKIAVKGDFIQAYCKLVEGTLGYEYVHETNRYYPRPTTIDLTTAAGARAALMHLIDSVEAVMQTIGLASTIYNFNYTLFSRNYAEVISFMTDLMNAIVAAENQGMKMNPQFYGMLEAMFSCCMNERLKALTDEYKKRVTKLQKQNLLSEYLKTTPSIDHKAGVPRGGTLILVYYEAPQPTVAGTPTTGNTNTGTPSMLMESRNAPAVLSENSNITDSNVNKVMDLIKTNEVQLTDTQKSTLIALIQNKLGTTSSDAFTITDGVVVADFYLPYVCCSDCPPVTYVFEKAVNLTLTMDKTSFCNDNDQNNYPVKASIDGGVLTASAGGIDAQKMTFNPKGVPAGVNQLTYTLEDGTKATLDLTISAPAAIDFTMTPDPNDGTIISFKATGTGTKPVSWNFGDGSAVSTDAEPKHTYQPTQDVQTYSVVLTMIDGPCQSTQTHEIRISKPQPAEFSIKPTVFCASDAQFYPFTIKPAITNITQITTNGLIIKTETANNNATGFVPKEQNLAATQSFTLVYKGINVIVKLIVPNAGFTMNLSRDANGKLSLELVAKQTDADTYDWAVTPAGRPKITSNEKKFVIDFSQNNMELGQSINIDLRVSYTKQTGRDNCVDTKNYVLTRAIEDNHLNKGAFDNVTPA